MKKTRKKIAVICMGFIVTMMLSACSPEDILESFSPDAITEWFAGLFTYSVKSDEDMIRDRIDQMVTDYNNGDIEAMMESLSPKTRTLMESTIGISESIMGGLIGFDLSFSDLFGLSVGLNAGDMMNVEIQSIDIQNEDTALVSAVIYLNASVGEYSSSETAPVTFVMEKDDAGFFAGEDWFIQTIR